MAFIPAGRKIILAGRRFICLRTRGAPVPPDYPAYTAAVTGPVKRHIPIPEIVRLIKFTVGTNLFDILHPLSIL